MIKKIIFDKKSAKKYNEMFIINKNIYLGEFKRLCKLTEILVQIDFSKTNLYVILTCQT